MKLSLKSTAKLVSALIIASPLLMVGCTCSRQENPDQVVPMEDPGMNEAPPAEGGSMMDEATPSDEDMAPPADDGGSMDMDQNQDQTEEITD